MPNEISKSKSLLKCILFIEVSAQKQEEKGAVVCDAVRCTSCRHGVVVGVVKWFVCRVGAVHWRRTSHRFSLKVDACN